MLIDVIDIVRDCVDGIDNTITFTVNGDMLLTCNTSYVSICDILTISGEDYEVTAIVSDESITLDRDVLDVNATETTIKTAKFRHGTVSNVNAELLKDLDKDPTENYPFVFLLEELEIDYNTKILPYARSVVKLFFITQTNYEDYTTEDHHKKTIEPLKSLVSGFLESVKNNNNIEGLLIDSFTTNIHPIFGYTDRDGYTENYLNDNLSAIQLTIELPFKYNKCCKNK